MFRYFFVLIVFLFLLISIVDSSVENVLDKGDRLLYEIKYRVGDIVYTDYFEIEIRDKYVADKSYFDIYIRYSNSTSGITIAKLYRSISSWDLSRVLSIADKSAGDFNGVVYVTIPVTNWNNRVADDEPIGAKILILKVNRTSEESIGIGSSRINALVTVLNGVSEGIFYEVKVDYYTGLLISLRAMRNDNELFSTNLVFYSDYVAVLQNSIGNYTVNRNNKSLNYIMPTIILAAISIIILLAIVSYLSRF
uniref:Uncharacterized protein n=1 Tax=Staphylothermus marinus TaxID=2280 RepID=A0A7C4D847_STAMA